MNLTTTFHFEHGRDLGAENRVDLRLAGHRDGSRARFLSSPLIIINKGTLSPSVLFE